MPPLTAKNLPKIRKKEGENQEKEGKNLEKEERSERFFHFAPPDR